MSQSFCVIWAKSTNTFKYLSAIIDLNFEKALALFSLHLKAELSCCYKLEEFT